jgi:hypothetical protein
MDAQQNVAFFLTGKRSGDLQAVEGLGLRPALFARYRHLENLRYDYPLVLVHDDAGGFVRPLSGIVDEALEQGAKGRDDADRIRMFVLRIEREIRRRVASGRTGRLSKIWEEVAGQAAKEDPSVEAGLRRVRAAIKVDGEVVDCDAGLPPRLLRHAWGAVQARKTQVFRRKLERLVLALSDILKASFERGEGRRDGALLRQSMGSSYAESFDFEALSQVLGKPAPASVFPESRRLRIEGLLRVLRAQQFVALSPLTGADPEPSPYSFLFESCSEALSAFRRRMPKQVELARAITIAELEVDGLYDASRHDRLFADFGANGLDPQELEAFPDYLVCLGATHLNAGEQAELMEILSSGLPIKVLLQVDDILEQSANEGGRLGPAVRARQIANMAIGLNEAYVLQSPASNLYRMRERLARGLAYRGPALFSVFSGASGKASGVAPYLVAAAAMESRAFPAFAYDPSAGANWALRFSLEANPQVELDWPVQSFAYEDENHQAVSEDLAFTLIDFVASDRRCARHLVRVPREQWDGALVPVDESLARPRKGIPDKIPFVWMVDGEDTLQKVIVDESLVREARRCREMWHSLQELGGVHNSHAEALLARERKAWEERMSQAAAQAAVAVPAATLPAAIAGASAATAAAPAPAAVEAEPEHSPDEAWIETPRCSTCNECTQINPKMFAYNENRQAYIADINAGTYGQLVDAAELCQVSVIHPGKPRNPNEPGLDELVKRAEAFA